MIRFGTDGWRDTMYDRFTLGPVRQVVQAIASHVHKHGGEDRGLVVGYDARFFSDRFAEEATAVLAGNRIKIFTMSRDLPTPVVAFAVQKEKAFGAVMFTASHNPPEYNGIKFIPEYAGPASPVITAEIESFLAQQIQGDGVIPAMPKGEAERCGLRKEIDPIPAYLEHLAGLIDRRAIAAAGLTLVVDPMHATARGLLPAFLGEFCPVEAINDRRDPLFGGTMPDPQADNLRELKARVLALPKAIGLAMDGDGDRFGIIDSDGTYLVPNQVISLLLVHLLESRRWHGVAVRSVATTHLIDCIGADHGVQTLETPVVYKYVGELMRTMPVIIGGEESGGLSIRGHIPEKDGLLACALAAEMRAVTGRPLTATLEDLYRKYGRFYSRRLDVHLPAENKERLMRAFTNDPPARVLGREVVEVRRLDGVKFILESGAWFLLRPSGTESLVRVYLESTSETEFEALAAWLTETVESGPDRAAC